MTQTEKLQLIEDLRQATKSINDLIIKSNKETPELYIKMEQKFSSMMNMNGAPKNPCISITISETLSY